MKPTSHFRSHEKTCSLRAFLFWTGKTSMCRQIWPLSLPSDSEKTSSKEWYWLKCCAFREGMKLRLFAMVNASILELLLACILAYFGMRSCLFYPLYQMWLFNPQQICSQVLLFLPESIKLSLRSSISTSMEMKHSHFWVNEPLDDSQRLRLCYPPRRRRAMFLGDTGSKVSKGLPKIITKSSKERRHFKNFGKIPQKIKVTHLCSFLTTFVSYLSIHLINLRHLCFLFQ